MERKEMKRGRVEAEGKKSSSSKGNHLGTELESLYNTSTARDPGFKDHISCWFKGGLRLSQRPNVVASWITPSKATCCLCWCTLRAEYLLRLSFFRAALRFTAKLRGRYRDFPYAPCSHTCLPRYLHPLAEGRMSVVVEGESDRPGFKSWL